MLDDILFIMSCFYVFYLIIKLLHGVSKWPLFFMIKYVIQ